MKYSPEFAYKKIADAYNNIASTGKNPDEITHGILRELEKPGKPKRPTSNLRPSLYDEKNQFKIRLCDAHIPSSISQK